MYYFKDSKHSTRNAAVLTVSCFIVQAENSSSQHCRTFAEYTQLPLLRGSG